MWRVCGVCAACVWRVCGVCVQGVLSNTLRAGVLDAATVACVWRVCCGGGGRRERPEEEEEEGGSGGGGLPEEVRRRVDAGLRQRRGGVAVAEGVAGASRWRRGGAMAGRARAGRWCRRCGRAGRWRSGAVERSTVARTIDWVTELRGRGGPTCK